ncbi:unnamed protein product [Pleuronectes platessa]|uniref:Uncharacterized protein n=1 Tax=Pleuronectes platessa TaxID=8262 RepID=A0A9N7ZBX9_PLEPL|nr:unnamed protein product [Pleuronectes platessa]
MSRPVCVQRKKAPTKKIEKVSRLSLHHHEDQSASPCKQRADPAPTAPSPITILSQALWLWENYTHVHKFLIVSSDSFGVSCRFLSKRDLSLNPSEPRDMRRCR